MFCGIRVQKQALHWTSTTSFQMTCVITTCIPLSLLQAKEQDRGLDLLQDLGLYGNHYPTGLSLYDLAQCLLHQDLDRTQ